MDKLAMGKAGLKGWRATVANWAAAPVARRSPASEDQVRAVVGGLFIALSVVYLVGAIRRLVART